MHNYLSEINVLLPQIFLAITACGLLLIGAFFDKCFKYSNIILSTAFLFSLYFLLVKTPDFEINAFNNLFKIDPLIKILQMLVILSAICFAIITGKKQFEGCSISRMDTAEFSSMIILATTGMLLMLSANNFLSFYVSLELQSFCLYVLAAFEREDSKSAEAGLKYFILGSFASGLLLFGISFIYGFSGNLDFDQLATLLNNSSSSSVPLGIIIGLIMVMIGMLFKISAAPFHMWTPDVYQGAPTIVTSFFATVAKIASLGILLRLVTHNLSGWKLDLQPILVLVTCASALIGAVGALRQDNLKRLLAYSSIGHVGFMLLAISTFYKDLSVILYLIIYVTMTLGVFAIIINIKVDDQNLENIQDLSGLHKEKPWIAAALAILMFSLAGIPPFAGFFAKFYVFNSALKDGLYSAIIVSIIAAVISAYYYLRIVKIMYLDKPKNKFSNEMTYSVKVLTLVLVLFNLFYILIA